MVDGKSIAFVCIKPSVTYAKEKDEAEREMVNAIDTVLPSVLTMMKKYPYFRTTGKRMILEWNAGKSDITEGAKRRVAVDKTVLDNMKLSGVKQKAKKINPYADLANSLTMKKKSTK